MIEEWFARGVVEESWMKPIWPTKEWLLNEQITYYNIYQENTKAIIVDIDKNGEFIL
jgi:hypothetical protein